MKFASLFTALILLMACGGRTTVSVDQLQGYWQIEKAVMPDGSERVFKVSPILDYIEVRGDSGVRKKVTPQLDGSFKVNRSAEAFLAKWEGDSLRLHYRTAYDTWTETILRTADSNLVVKNREGKIYHYRKFRTFSFDN